MARCQLDQQNDRLAKQLASPRPARLEAGTLARGRQEQLGGVMDCRPSHVVGCRDGGSSMGFVKLGSSIGSLMDFVS